MTSNLMKFQCSSGLFSPEIWHFVHTIIIFWTLLQFRHFVIYSQLSDTLQDPVFGKGHRRSESLKGDFLEIYSSRFLNVGDDMNFAERTMKFKALLNNRLTLLETNSAPLVRWGLDYKHQTSICSSLFRNSVLSKRYFHRCRNTNYIICSYGIRFGRCET